MEVTQNGKQGVKFKKDTYYKADICLTIKERSSPRTSVVSTKIPRFRFSIAGLTLIVTWPFSATTGEHNINNDKVI